MSETNGEGQIDSEKEEKKKNSYFSTGLQPIDAEDHVHVY